MIRCLGHESNDFGTSPGSCAARATAPQAQPRRAAETAGRHVAHHFACPSGLRRSPVDDRPQGVGQRRYSRDSPLGRDNPLGSAIARGRAPRLTARQIVETYRSGLWLLASSAAAFAGRSGDPLSQRVRRRMPDREFRRKLNTRNPQDGPLLRPVRVDIPNDHGMIWHLL